LSRVGIYTDQVYNIVHQNKSFTYLPFGKTEALPIIIIGKEHCYESSKELPIGKLDEAISAAAHIEEVAPFQGVNYYIAEVIDRDKTRINFFTIKQSVYKKFSSSSVVIIPESMLIYCLLNKSTSSSELQSIRTNSHLSAFLNKDGFKSLVKNQNQGELESIVQHLVLTQEESAVYDENDYIKISLKQLLLLPKYCYRQIFNFMPFKQRLNVLPLRLMAASSIAIVFCYLLLSSGWLYYQKDSLEQKLSEQRDSLNEVFSLQKSFEDEIALQHAYKNNKKLSELTSNVWQVLLPLISTNSEILSINYFNGEYTMRVKSKKSTDVIQFLSDNLLITAPKMVSPAVKSRGKEIITLKFSLLNKVRSYEPA